MRQLRVILILTVICGSMPSIARAQPLVRLSATLTPERLGHSTTIGFGFSITDPARLVPPPLTGLDVSYPGLGIAPSGLGLLICSPTILEALGPDGCPPDARMGYGTALTEIPIGPEIVEETADISIVRGPAQHKRFTLLFYANGLTPVNAQIVFPGPLFSAPPPFGGAIHMEVPLVPSLPGAPDVAVVQVHSTIGPQHLTYFEEVNGKTVAYKPTGVRLPDRCPRGGFPFAATLTFQDGSHASASTSVPCPRAGSKSRRSGSRR